MQDAADVVGRELGGDVVTYVTADPRHRILEVEHRPARLGRQPARLAADNDGRDGEDERSGENGGDQHCRDANESD